MNIFLTKPEANCILENKDAFLGKWCLGDRLKYFDKDKHLVLNYHWSDHEKVENDYNYLKNLYYKLLDYFHLL